ncbi:MAG TPA: sulfotransferase [Anaerolineales bacterium]|nr:sulfotransferase [Anaerolineales bacterium]
MARPDYVFIVGMDRTGSTLTRDILNRSDGMGLAGEAQYFRRRPHWSLLPDHGHRGLFNKIGDLSTDEGATKVIDHLFGDPQGFSGFWHFSMRGFNREELLGRLLKTDCRERALLDLALESHARGKPIRGEKTPANIFFVPTLMEWFPNTKIIQTFRDPRAIYSSRENKKERHALPRFNQMIRRTGIIFELYASSRVILDWRRSIRFHRQYQSKYPGRYYLSKYEDLVCNPENAIRNLCTFLEVEFRNEMLHQPVVNSSFVPRGSSQPRFDTSAVDRWRQHVHPFITRWMTALCREQLLEFGYQP